MGQGIGWVGWLAYTMPLHGSKRNNNNNNNNNVLFKKTTTTTTPNVNEPLDVKCASRV